MVLNLLEIVESGSNNLSKVVNLISYCFFWGGGGFSFYGSIGFIGCFGVKVIGFVWLLRKSEGKCLRRVRCESERAECFGLENQRESV